MFEFYFREYQKQRKKHRYDGMPGSITRMSNWVILELSILLVLLIVYAVAEFNGEHKAAAISVAFASIDIIVLMIAPKYCYDGSLKKQDSVEKWGLTNRIEAFEQFLQEQNMYDEASLELLIKLCGIELESEKAKKSLSGGGFFTSVVFAMIAAVTALAIEDLNSVDVFRLAVVAIMVVSLLYFIASLIYSDIKVLIYRRRYALEAFWEDLEYILYRFEKQS